MLARLEEVDPPSDLLDNHNRFPASASHAFRFCYLDRPIVDEWLLILRQVVERLWPRLLLVQTTFNLVLSHDVDIPSAYGFSTKSSLVRSVISDLLKRRHLIQTVSAPLIHLNTKQKLHPRDPYNTFDWLMDISDFLGISSSFYFICGRTNPYFDSQYDPDHPAIRHLMRRVHDRGHQIGLHPSYDTCNHPNLIFNEAERLRQICSEESIEQTQWGGRMHYLRWVWPITAYGWEKAAFDYDSTLCYADRPGFRCGTCHSFQMFDPIAQCSLRLIQRPLVVMECSVLEKTILVLDMDPLLLISSKISKTDVDPLMEPLIFFGIIIICIILIRETSIFAYVYYNVSFDYVLNIDFHSLSKLLFLGLFCFTPIFDLDYEIPPN